MNWLRSLFSAKPDWESIIDNADLKTRVEAQQEAFADWIDRAFYRHLCSVYGKDNVKSTGRTWRVVR